MEPEVAFGLVLRELRLQCQLSQERLAFAADLQRNYISLLERGINAASLRTLFKLAPVLDVTVSDLMARTEAKLQSSTRRRR